MKKSAMDTKSRVWIGVLIVLLIAAIVGMVVLNNRLNAKQTEVAELTAALTEARQTAVPATVAPATEVPATDVPATEVPATDVPATDVPATDVPATEVPATDVPATDAPATAVPATEKPSDVIVATAEPTSSVIARAELMTAEERSAQYEAAQAATIDLKTRVDENAAEVAAVEAELTEAQSAEKVDTAAVEELGTRLEALNEESTLLEEQLTDAAADEKAWELACAQDTIATLEGQVTTLQGEVTKLQGRLDEAEQMISSSDRRAIDLEADLEAAQGEVSTLQNKINANEQQVAELVTELEAQGTSDSETIAALNTAIETAQAEGKALQAQLSAATADYEVKLAASDAYYIDHEPSDGQAHSASTVENILSVEADGVTADWGYQNSTLSGNAAEVVILVDDTEVYHSAELKPGEALDIITLETSLTAGTYAARAVTYSRNAEGEIVSTTIVPITVQVK